MDIRFDQALKEVGREMEKLEKEEKKEAKEDRDRGIVTHLDLDTRVSVLSVTRLDTRRLNAQ